MNEPTLDLLYPLSILGVKEIVVNGRLFERVLMEMMPHCKYHNTEIQSANILKVHGIIIRKEPNQETIDAFNEDISKLKATTLDELFKDET